MKRLRELVLDSEPPSTAQGVVEACLRTLGFFTSPSGQTAVLRRELWGDYPTLCERTVLLCGALGLDVTGFLPPNIPGEPSEEDGDRFLDAFHAATMAGGELGKLAFTIEARDTLVPALETALQAGDFPTPAPAAPYLLFELLREHARLKSSILFRHEREDRSENVLTWLLCFLREHTGKVRELQGIEALSNEHYAALWKRIATVMNIETLEGSANETLERTCELRAAHRVKLNAAMAERGEYHEDIGMMLYDHGVLTQSFSHAAGNLLGAEALFRRAHDVFAVATKYGDYYAMLSLEAQAEVLLALGRAAEGVPLMRRVMVDWGSPVAGAHHFPCYFRAESGYRTLLRAVGKAEEEIEELMTSARKEAGFRS